MIAESVDFTLKKSTNNQLVLTVIAILAVVLADFVIHHNYYFSAGIVAVVSHGVLLSWVVAAYKKSQEKNSEIIKLRERETMLSAELETVSNRCEVRSEFIEKFGKMFLNESRTMHESLGLMQSMRKAGIEKGASEITEKNLLDSAARLHECSRDIVTLSQLESGRVFEIGQEIDPIELVQYCILEIKKKYPCIGKIDFAEKPDCKMVLTGDLVKMKQLLIKMMSCSVRQAQDTQAQDTQAMGSGVEVRLIYQKPTGLTFTVKLNGYYLSTSQFQRLCSPLEKYKKGTKADLGLAIAKRLAKLHGCDLEIKEQSASGSVLSFCLPDERVRMVDTAEEIEQFEEIKIY